MLPKCLSLGAVALVFCAASAAAQMQPEIPQASGSSVYSGIAGQISVQPPRLEEEAIIDGALTDSAWSKAALLTGFSQFQPKRRPPGE